MTFPFPPLRFQLYYPPFLQFLLSLGEIFCRMCNHSLPLQPSTSNKNLFQKKKRENLVFEFEVIFQFELFVFKKNFNNLHLLSQHHPIPSCCFLLNFLLASSFYEQREKKVSAKEKSGKSFKKTFRKQETAFLFFSENKVSHVSKQG